SQFGFRKFCTARERDRLFSIEIRRRERMRSECRDHWSGHDVFLDATDSGDSFRRDPQRLPLFARLILGDPEMNDPVADNNVLWPDLRPLLAAELGEETGADRAVVALTLVLWCTLCRSDRADDVCAADDPDKPALAHDRHALDPLRLQQRRVRTIIVLIEKDGSSSRPSSR